MQEAYVDIDEVPTHIMTWGQWIEESFGSKKEVCICITGNPGLPGFYTHFLSTVHNALGQEIPTWVIGHTGHDEPAHGSIRRIPDLQGNEHKFDLKGNVAHKVAFITTYVPENVKIHLIGHSIGAWMVLELLKVPEVRSRVQHCYLLFPTIERMAISPNGFILTRLVAPIYFAIRFFFYFLSILPTSLQICLLWAYFMCVSIPKHFMGTVLKYIHPTAIDKIWFLALDEMAVVKQLDVDHIERNKSILKFFYGTNDWWVPKKYFYQLKQAIYDVDAELDSHGISHAFMMKSSVEFGRMVAEWIMSKRLV